MAKGVPPDIERKLRAEIERMQNMLFRYSAEAYCAKLDLAELYGEDELGPELEIAEAAIARAKMRGID